jgi:hypothetical protein
MILFLVWDSKKMFASKSDIEISFCWGFVDKFCHLICNIYWQNFRTKPQKENPFRFLHYLLIFPYHFFLLSFYNFAKKEFSILHNSTPKVKVEK